MKKIIKFLFALVFFSVFINVKAETTYNIDESFVYETPDIELKGSFDENYNLIIDVLKNDSDIKCNIYTKFYNSSDEIIDSNDYEIVLYSTDDRIMNSDASDIPLIFETKKYEVNTSCEEYVEQEEHLIVDGEIEYNVIDGFIVGTIITSIVLVFFAIILVFIFLSKRNNKFSLENFNMTLSYHNFNIKDVTTEYSDSSEIQNVLKATDSFYTEMILFVLRNNCLTDSIRNLAKGLFTAGVNNLDALNLSFSSDKEKYREYRRFRNGCGYVLFTTCQLDQKKNVKNIIKEILKGNETK